MICLIYCWQIDETIFFAKAIIDSIITLSRALHSHAKRSQEQKIKCIVHYFERICLCMPMGSVSFERKVLPLKQSCDGISYPEAAFWRKSTVSLCPFEVKLKIVFQTNLPRNYVIIFPDFLKQLNLVS